MNAPAPSECSPLLRVLLSPPDHFDLYPNNEIAKNHLRRGKRADRDAAAKEHERLAETLAAAGCEVLQAEPRPGLPYQVFTRDLGVALPGRLWFGNFVHAVRRGEIDAAGEALDGSGPPRTQLDPGGPACFEGGDAVFLGDGAVAVGLGARTNRAGLEAFRAVAEDEGLHVVPVPFAERFLHLDMIFSVVAERLAVACLDALPERFRAWLRKRDFDVIEAPLEGAFEMHCNLLALGGGLVVSPASNRRVNRSLRARGLEVLELPLEALMMGGGGPRCLSFPVLRGFPPPHTLQKGETIP